MAKSKMICGDYLDALNELPENSVDLILTDPPYGVTKNKWDVELDVHTMWEAFNRVLKNVGTAIIFAQDKFMVDVIKENEKKFKYTLIWHYTQPTGFLNVNKRPLRTHQEILVFSCGGGMYNRVPYIKKSAYHAACKTASTNYGQIPVATTNSDGWRAPTTVLTFKAERGLHPTQKPVTLLRWLIESYSNSAAVVLDPFMGSGSTGIAAVQTNRNFIGVEILPKYFDTAKRRILEAGEEVV